MFGKGIGHQWLLKWTEAKPLAREKIKFGIGVITHRRADMLRALLLSLAEMALPDDAECQILIAENDDALSIEPLISELAETLPFEVKCRLETERGIPFARNCVLDMAIENDCDFLTFVDDDETVLPDWLVNLYTAMSKRELDLVGGPIIYDPPAGMDLTWQQAAVLYELRRRAAKAYALRESEIGNPREAEFGIYTNNWMVRIAACTRLGIRFDEALRYSGGSDTKFYADFSAAGGRTGWAPDARVREVWPLHRLTFKYYFRRCRDQETARRIRTAKEKSKIAALVMLVYGILRALVFTILAPFTRLRSVAVAARAIGKGVGRVKAAYGRNSDLYHPDKNG